VARPIRAQFIIDQNGPMGRNLSRARRGCKNLPAVESHFPCRFVALRRAVVCNMKHTHRNGNSRLCLSCKQLFTTDPRNHHHQRFCTRARCRKASKILSQKQWLAKPGNRKLGGGPGEVERVRIWRKANPYYWKRTFPLFRRC
jgi:hypothetical protein